MSQQSQNPLVAFAIVGWNNQNILTECLDSISDQTYKNHKTFYLDNASSDDSVKMISDKYASVEIIKSDKNLGFAKGNNRLVEEILKDQNVEYVVLLNSDARVDERWLEELINFASYKKTSAIFQGRTLDYYNHDIIDSTHIYIAQNGQGTQGNWRHVNIGITNPRKVFGANAAACLISRRFIEAQPFKTIFDEAFFMYLEDVDLSARATVMGWDNYYVPRAVAYHMGSASSGKSPGFSLYMTYKNNLPMIIKNYPIRMIVKLLPKMIKSDFYTAKGLINKGQNRAVWYILKGRMAGLITLPIYVLKAYKIHKVRCIDYEYLWQLMREGY